jgi:hypothetical protein
MRFTSRSSRATTINALCGEVDLIAIGAFPTGEIEAVGTLKDFVDIQLIGA